MAITKSIRIPISQITVEKPLRLNRSDEKTGFFIDGIEKIGMINPIDVREFWIGSTVQYELVCGRRRLAAAKLLGWTHVDAVIGDWPQDQVEFVRCVENLQRRHLNAAQEAQHTQVLLAEYQKLWGKTAPEHVAGGQARAAEATRSEGGAQQKGTFLPKAQSPAEDIVSAAGADPVKQAENPKSATSKIPSPAKLLSSARDITEREARRDVMVANALTPDQLKSLEPAEHVSQKDLLKIAAIEDQTKRAEVVNAVALGEEVDAAIRDVVGVPKGAMPTDGDMSDADWLTVYCGEFARRIQDPRSYNRDAMLYKQSREFLKKLKAGVKDSVAAARQGGTYSPFALTMHRLITLCHPSEWLLCGTCRGANMDKPKCEDCRGCGYKTRHDYQPGPKKPKAAAEESI